MEQEKDLVSIKEFSEIVGISQQAIYKQLNGKLKKYSTKVENRTMLKISAIEEVYGIKKFNQVEQLVDNQVEKILSQNQQIIELLQKELEQKNREIDNLHSLLDQQQRLNAIDKQKILELEEKNDISESASETIATKKNWFSRIFKG